MNTTNAYANQYRKNQLETATPEEILILLYDAAINFLNKAKVSLDQKEYVQFSKDVMNCRNIIMEFINTLDMENGGKVAGTLHSLYRYYHMVLVKSELNKNLDGIEEVQRHLINLRGTWQQAIEIAKKERESSSIDKYEAGSNDSPSAHDEYYDDGEEDDDDEYEEDDEDEDS